MLLRDFYPLIRDYSVELDMPLSHFMGPSEIKLATVSAEHQESVQDKLKIKIESHIRRWEQLKNVSGFIEKMKSKTVQAVQSSKRNRDSFYELTSCPACENDALLSVEIDYDYCEGQVNPIGAFVSNLKCLFCKFVIEDYDEIDHLGLNDLLIPEEDFGI